MLVQCTVYTKMQQSIIFNRHVGRNKLIFARNQDLDIGRWARLSICNKQHALLQSAEGGSLARKHDVRSWKHLIYSQASPLGDDKVMNIENTFISM